MRPTIRDLLSVECVVRAVIAFLLGAGTAIAQDVDRRKEDVWKIIAPYFQPPAELTEDPGKYRSPLVFNDGRPVRTPDDWRHRREEILQFWHKSLGPWPPLIENPTIAYLETRDRENFTQQKIRLQVAPSRGSAD